jgi:integrase
MPSVPEQPRRRSRGSISQRENGDCRGQVTISGKRISGPWLKTKEAAEEWLAQALTDQPTPRPKKARRRERGTVFVTSDGRARAQLTVRGGKRVSSPTVGSKELADEWLAAAIVDDNRGKTWGNQSQTVADYLEWWLDEWATKRVAPRTLATWRGYTKNHLIPALGQHRLVRLDPQHVQAFINAEANRYKPRTVIQVRAVLRDALTHAERLQLVPRNVAKLVVMPRLVDEERQVLNPTETRALLTGLRGHRWEALYAVTVVCGMRQGEVLGLRWSDVDFERGTITVNGALQRQSVDPTAKWGARTEHRRVPPKTLKSRRTLSPPAFVLDLFHQHRARQLETRLQSAPIYTDNGLVFARDDGHPMNEAGVTRELQRLLVELGLRRVTFHDLRHSAASLLENQGLKSKEVSEILGHANVGVTLKIYTHLFGTASEHAKEALDAWYAEGAEPHG